MMQYYDASRNLLAFLNEEGKILKVYSGPIAIEINKTINK